MAGLKGSRRRAPKRTSKNYGRARHIYRVLFSIDNAERIVYVLNVRRGAREALGPPTSRAGRSSET